MTSDEYEKIYATWGSLKQCRVHIAYERNGEQHGERTWGRVLSDGTFGIDNHPLCSDYRWQDIVSSTEITSEKFLVHRRWNTMIWCTYTPAMSDTEEGDIVQRTAMAAACSADMNIGWWSDGILHVHFLAAMTDDDAFRRVQETLGLLVDDLRR